MAKTDTTTTTFSKIKKGEYFRFLNGTRTYIYDGKVRCYDLYGKFVKWGFSYVPENDCLGDWKSTRTDRQIIINF